MNRLSVDLIGFRPGTPTDCQESLILQAVLPGFNYFAFKRAKTSQPLSLAYWTKTQAPTI
ncbi:hypothetical protein [Corynebacterium cystitidis]|uniref:hypothetical protein n=1 Tax=Corynebacterium cystitidis TaxID=35757 RepID=UPI00211EED32|nr:hypothetical protein [Corynebacterium cystitidis]